LNDSFALLTSDSRASSERHQTLQASMDWDWGLLDTAEQVFLQQLSVFAGGWTLEAAQAVCDDDVLGLTDSLVKKSLVMVNQESGSKTRYRFHEIIRQYVREKLIELSEEENIRTRHLKYFLRFSEQAELALKGPAQIEWYTRVTDERDNIRSALKWADKTDAEAGLFISGRLWRFWEDFDLREGEGWLRTFLAKSESHHLHARAKALYAYGIILYLTMQYDLLGKIAEECLAIYRAIGDPYGEIDGLIVSSRFYFAKNDTTQTMELMQQALVLAESLGDTWRIAFMFGQLGWGSGSDNNCSQRLHYFQEAVSLFRKVGDLRELQEYLGSLGNYEILSGNLE
jgi:non-specific serine/threonine protein kinase